MRVLLGVVALWSLGTDQVRAAGRWVDTRQSGPFICQAEFPLDEYDPLLLELQQLQPELVRILGVTPAPEPVYIYLFADAESHRRFLKEHYPDVPYRPALFVKEGGMAGVYAYKHDDLATDLRHECTHALLHAALPMVPLWLDEGLAKYFEVPADERAFDHPYFGSLRWDMRLGMIRTVSDLEQRHELAEMGASEYRYSWAWVHFMLHGPRASHATLVHYLADIQRGEIAGNLSEQLETAIPGSTERMVQHFKYWHR
ncbi:MAG: hypothetical protein AB7G28_21625 [Pirellulales bacterium]